MNASLKYVWRQLSAVEGIAMGVAVPKDWLIVVMIIVTFAFVLLMYRQPAGSKNRNALKGIVLLCVAALIVMIVGYLSFLIGWKPS